MLAAEELQWWLKQQGNHKVDQSAWARRWGTNMIALKKFMEGDINNLSPQTLLAISRDTKIPIKSLMTQATMCKLKKSEIDLTPSAICHGSGRPLMILVMPAAVRLYKPNLDFKENALWLRSAEDLVLAPNHREFLFSTGLRIMDSPDFVTEFHISHPNKLFGRLRNYKEKGLYIGVVNLTMCSYAINAGERIGIVKFGIVSHMIPTVFAVPKEFERAARKV